MARPECVESVILVWLSFLQEIKILKVCRALYQPSEDMAKHLTSLFCIILCDN